MLLWVAGLLHVTPQDKLQKEERNSTVNRLKLTQQWRAVLRKARVEELHRDVAVLSQTFERILDHKDSTVKVRETVP